MTMTFDEGKPSPEEYLEHYGKKGMKWGQRKKYSTADIHNARTRQRARSRNLGDLESRAVLATNPKTKKTLEKKFNDAEKKANAHPDAAIGSRLTRGEKTATVILAGPLGLIVIGANAHAVRKLERQNKQ